MIALTACPGQRASAPGCGARDLACGPREDDDVVMAEWVGRREDRRRP
jgi:hypothetical protein